VNAKHEAKWKYITSTTPMAHQEDSQCTKISPKLSLLSTKILSQILVAKLAHERAHERGGEDRNFGIIEIL